MEWDFCIYDANRNKIPLSVEPLGPPWMARFIALLQSAVRSRGGDIDGIGQMETLIQNHPAFEEVKHAEFWFPTMPRPQTDPNLVTSAKGIMENNIVRCFIPQELPLTFA
jgi:hypothetical protein